MSEIVNSTNDVDSKKQDTDNSDDEFINIKKVTNDDDSDIDFEINTTSSNNNNTRLKRKKIIQDTSFDRDDNDDDNEEVKDKDKNIVKIINNDREKEEKEEKEDEDISEVSEVSEESESENENQQQILKKRKFDNDISEDVTKGDQQDEAEDEKSKRKTKTKVINLNVKQRKLKTFREEDLRYDYGLDKLYKLWKSSNLASSKPVQDNLKTLLNVFDRWSKDMLPGIKLEDAIYTAEKYGKLSTTNSIISSIENGIWNPLKQKDDDEKEQDENNKNNDNVKNSNNNNNITTQSNIGNNNNNNSNKIDKTTATPIYSIPRPIPKLLPIKLPPKPQTKTQN